MDHVAIEAKPSSCTPWKPEDIAVDSLGVGSAVTAVATAIFLASALSGTIIIPLTAVIVVGAVGLAVMLVSAIYLAEMKCRENKVVKNEDPLSDDGIRKSIMADQKSPVDEIRSLLTKNAETITVRLLLNIEYKIPKQFYRDMEGDTRYLINDEVVYCFDYNPEIQDKNDSKKFYLELMKCCIDQAGEEKGRVIAERIARCIVQTSSADLVKSYVLEYLDKGMSVVPDRIDDVYRVWFSNDEVIIEKKECYIMRDQNSRNYLESRVNTRTVTISMNELAVENLEASKNPLPSLVVTDEQTKLSDHLPEVVEGLPDDYMDYTGEQHDQIRKVNEEWKQKLTNEFREWYLFIEWEALDAKKNPKETKKDI